MDDVHPAADEGVATVGRKATFLPVTSTRVVGNIWAGTRPPLMRFLVGVGRLVSLSIIRAVGVV